jgi:aryl-alcohol dehydrogenase-like predicted oxidoreductase
MSRCTRRDFFKSTLAASVLAGSTGALKAATEKRSATDLVTLGNSGVKVTRLAFGTGSHGGRVQRELGQEQFTRLVRHAYDSGIRFFETAESYNGMPEMLGIALKGIPRDSYKLMTKFTPTHMEDAQGRIDQFRRQTQSEYFDILLVHCVRKPTWAADYEPIRDQFSESKHKKVILSHGASVHGLPALRTFPGNKWLDVAMIRMNHNGTRMDTDDERDVEKLGDVNEVVAHMKKVHAQGAGIISMKLVGEGRFTNPEDREASLKHSLNLGLIDTVTIGFKSTAEIDEAIERMNRVMNA